MQPAIVVKDLRRVFKAKSKADPPVIACDGVSFEVRRGEIFGLLGPNGAGKSTLVHQLLGLIKPDAGQIWVEGLNVVANPEKVKLISGFLPQSGTGMRFIEVERALHYTGRLRGQSEQAARQQARALIEELGLGSYAQKYVNHLSGGLKRLVNFGMALMSDPRLLILDEPTNELDPQNRKLVWDIIGRLNQEHSVTCVLVTHNVLEAEQVISRVGVMQHGQIVAFGTPGELKSRLGGRVRFELVLKAAGSLTPAQHSTLVQWGELQVVRPDHYRLLVEARQVAALTEWIVNQLGFDSLDDFHVALPSLEEIYLSINSVVPNSR